MGEAPPRRRLRGGDLEVTARLRIGVDVPYFQSSADIRTYVRAIEELGFDHVGYSEHVCMTLDSPFPTPMFKFDEPWRESITMGSYIAGATDRIEINPSMLLLPLYHPVLAAKQLAELANLAGSRVRVAASIGWNTREVESLGVDPATRGARFEEQLVVMRRLWTERTVDHDGRFFRLSHAGINARPAEPIPIWMGAGRMERNGVPGTAGLRRAARLADGFKFAAPTFLERDAVESAIGTLRAEVAAAGRDPAAFGIEVRMPTQMTTPEEWPSVVAWAKRMGASHLSVANRIAGGTVKDQIDICRQFVDATREAW
jgi:probable F420-dependent oxidoreductase